MGKHSIGQRHIIVDHCLSIHVRVSRQLGALVKIDGKILDDETVASAVEGRFMDSAISVREFVVDLFGKYILVCPNLVDKVTNVTNW